VRFLRPEFAPWWQLLPILLAACTIRYLYLRRQRRLTPVTERFRSLSRRSTGAREAAIASLTLLAGGALVFALARPQAQLTTRTPQYEREDLVIMLDRSASMRAHDVTPSRFSRATEEIRTFLKNKPENIDRVGLVGFASSSLILSYLTRDLDTVAFYLDWIEQDPQTFFGTNIGAALKNALEVARKDDRKTRKIFVILSDGEDYGGELNRQLTIYRQEGHHINSIGIGSDEEVPVPEMQPDGKEIPLRDEGGRIVRPASRNPRCASWRATREDGTFGRGPAGISPRRSTKSSRGSASWSAGAPRPNIAICIQRRWRWRRRRWRDSGFSYD
jgi:Ca-activated chloride channel homolog